MPIVTGAEENLVNYKSYKNRITYVEITGVRNIVKSYRATLRRSAVADAFLSDTFDYRRQGWLDLSQPEKDSWNNKASEMEMTGFDLFVQDGYKMGLNAISGVGISNFCYSNGAI